MPGRATILALAAIGLAAAGAVAGEAEVTAAHAEWTGRDWRFTVTVRHADEGWQHYADAWRVVGADGTVYGLRELLHPHVDEQPFSRSLPGVAVPDSVAEVFVEARDSVHGWGPGRLAVRLAR